MAESRKPLKKSLRTSRRRKGNRITPEERIATQDAFLQAYGETGNVMAACQRANIGHTTLYHWRGEDPVFAARWNEPKEEMTVRLEGRLYERAMNDDTTAAIFLLKSLRPHIYRDHWEGDMPPPAWAQVQASAQATVFVIDGQQKGLETMSLEDLERAKGALLAERAGQGGDVAAGGEVHNSVDEPAPE